ncbi:MAG TPA: condensation domain-containing protein, partial [Longimicrobiaceae bacterium]|nr:condensation domain-containing protein [Longimicrobiaceae bacterium]
MDGRAGLIATLSAEQLSLLQARLKSLRGGGQEPERIPRREGAGPAPLSFAQERIWLQDRMEPGAAAFNLSLAVRLVGVLDRGALQRSLDEIVRRHEVLRTAFEMREEGPVQVVRPPRGIDLRTVELDGEADPDATVLRRADAEARLPIDLDRDLPFRPVLFRLGPEEHVLLLVLHHIATDRWSFGVL